MLHCFCKNWLCNHNLARDSKCSRKPTNFRFVGVAHMTAQVNQVATWGPHVVFFCILLYKN